LCQNSRVQRQHQQEQQQTSPKYWEMIADGLHKAGWSYGISTQQKDSGELLHCVDAHRDGRRHIVHSDELLTAFMELELQTQEAAE
jgi:hypothetical protein